MLKIDKELWREMKKGGGALIADPGPFHSTDAQDLPIRKVKWMILSPIKI